MTPLDEANLKAAAALCLASHLMVRMPEEHVIEVLEEIRETNPRFVPILTGLLRAVGDAMEAVQEEGTER